MAGEAQEKLQRFFLSRHLELLTGLSHHHITFKITSVADDVFHCKAEKWKRVSKFVGFVEALGVPAGATSTDSQMCHQDWQRHLGSCLLCAVSHVQAGGCTCSSLLASTSLPCKGAFSVLMLPCSPGIAQPAFLTIPKEAPLTPRPC